MNTETVDLLKSGDVFRGYAIQRCLGKGGAAAVYLARHEVLDTFYALKVLRPSIVSDGNPDFLRRFLREARLATRIHHPNLVTVHDCGHDAERDLYYLVMDYVSGSSLRDTLAFEGKLSAKNAASIVAQVASALDAAQAFHVVHRDIKPENIMVQPDGCIKLVDLGIAKAKNLGDSFTTNTDSTFGTPSYISPEQAQNFSDVDTRADVYSLGMVFFEMLTGKCPYIGDNPAHVLAQILSDDPVPDVRDFARDIPPGLAVLIRRMTVKDRDRRIPSFRVVLDELDRLGLGNVSKLPLRSEYAACPAEGMKTLLDGLGKESVSDADPLANPDDDMREFLENRDMAIAKKSQQWRMVLVGVSVVLAFVVFLIVLHFLKVL